MTMMRDLNLVIIADINNEASRTLLSDLEHSTSTIQKTVLTPQVVKSILPGVRATPAVGILLWATDLQGLAADVDAFAEYIRDETTNKQTIADAVDISQAYVDLLSQQIVTDNGLEV